MCWGTGLELGLLSLTRVSVFGRVSQPFLPSASPYIYIYLFIFVSLSLSLVHNVFCSVSVSLFLSLSVRFLSFGFLVCSRSVFFLFFHCFFLSLFISISLFSHNLFLFYSFPFSLFLPFLFMS